MTPDDRLAISDALLRNAAALDGGDMAGYLASFLPHANYRLTALVPELDTINTWLDLDRPALERLVLSAGQHVWNTGQRRRILGQSRLWTDSHGIGAETGVAIYRTDEHGHTHLYAVGRYVDLWQGSGTGWYLADRECRLDSRQLSPPSALPL